MDNFIYAICPLCIVAWGAFGLAVAHDAVQKKMETKKQSVRKSGKKSYKPSSTASSLVKSRMPLKY